MTRLALFALGTLCVSALLTLIGLGWLRQFILEPDYMPGFVDRNNGGGTYEIR